MARTSIRLDVVPATRAVPVVGVVGREHAASWSCRFVGPRKPTISPTSTRKETPLTASRAPNRLERPLTSIIRTTASGLSRHATVGRRGRQRGPDAPVGSRKKLPRPGFARNIRRLIAYI
jgi:hypothetical protein